MSKPSNIKTITQPAQTEEVVQEYMDNLLADTFPDIPDNPVNNVVELAKPDSDVAVATETATETKTESSVTEVELQAEPEHEIEAQVETTVEEKTPDTETQVIESTDTVTVVEESESVEVEKRYPQAPSWAQEEFDVLLFEVCGLKLAVSMESLGRIIKVDHEPNHLIGRPDWFLGAYNEADNHYYVVDTAKYIMPEKGFDLTESGYEYVIQMQHSKWTLACQKLHTTVRLHPESVKWRTVKGKRPWLAGTVVDQMCALVHVDSLIEILDEASAS